MPASLFASLPAGAEHAAAGGPASPAEDRIPVDAASATPARPPGAPAEGPDDPAVQDEDAAARFAAAAAALEMVAGRRRPARYGLLVQFESRSEDTELARLVDSTIWINEAHPAYARALASRALGYHTALSVALALAPLAVEAGDEHAFITRFLSHWGSAQTAGRTGPHRARKPARRGPAPTPTPFIVRG